MIPAAFTYHAPANLRQAIRLMREFEDARVIAGGMSLVPAMKLRLVQPEHLVDIGVLEDLRYVRRTDDGIAVGAASTYRDVQKSRSAAKISPLLLETIAQVGDIQVRNKGTVAGSAAHADPAADVPAALLASEAKMWVVGGARSRAIPADRFFIDAYETALEPNEILAEVRIPKVPPRTGYAYVKFANKASRFAVVGVAALVTVDKRGVCTRVRIAVAGAGPRPHRARAAERLLTAKSLDGAAIARAAGRSAEGLEFLADIHGSEEYREHLTRVISQRAVALATERAGIPLGVAL